MKNFNQKVLFCRNPALVREVVIVYITPVIKIRRSGHSAHSTVRMISNSGIRATIVLVRSIVPGSYSARCPCFE